MVFLWSTLVQSVALSWTHWSTFWVNLFGLLFIDTPLHKWSLCGCLNLQVSCTLRIRIEHVGTFIPWLLYNSRVFQISYLPISIYLRENVHIKFNVRVVIRNTPLLDYFDGILVCRELFSLHHVALRFEGAWPMAGYTLRINWFNCTWVICILDWILLLWIIEKLNFLQICMPIPLGARAVLVIFALFLKVVIRNFLLNSI